jgi:hypothetical protein
MKHLKLFESFKEEDILTVHSICYRYNIYNYTINEDGSIDVGGSVSLESRTLTKLPLKFRNISNSFFCQYNNLTSLEGCPESVSDYFACNNNQLVSLEGCPKSVGDNFACYENNLTSLEGCPESVGGDFNCRHNKITTFEHLPLSIGGDFYCVENPIFRVWKLFEDYSKIELFNYYDIIQDDVVILDRLNIFLEEIGKPTVTEVSRYKCI